MSKKIVITPEMRAELASCPSAIEKISWDKGAEDFLYDNYHRYLKRDLARIFGVSEKTLLKKYLELKKEREHEE